MAEHMRSQRSSTDNHTGENHGRRKRPMWIRIAILLCALIFLTSGFVVARKLYVDWQGARAYEELRLLANQDMDAVDPNEMSVPVEGDVDPDVDGDHGQNQAVPQRPMDFDAIKAVNSDIVAWLKLEGTAIDYPVMKGTDNDYYLNHTYSGAVNACGSLFADFRNTELFDDRNTVIYGHYMHGGSMFGALASYKAQAFYDNHTYMLLSTPECDYRVELFCGTVEDGNHQFVRFDFDSDEDFLDYINSFKARSTFVSHVEVEGGDKIVSLCTCSYETDNSRFMVMGKLVPIDDKAQ